MLLSYHPIFLLPYHFLKPVSFLGANRTKSASVGPRLLRGAIQLLEYNTIQYNNENVDLNIDLLYVLALLSFFTNALAYAFSCASYETSLVNIGRLQSGWHKAFQVFVRSIKVIGQISALLLTKNDVMVQVDDNWLSQALLDP